MANDTLTIKQLKALSNRIEKEIAGAVYYKLKEFEAESGLEIVGLNVDVLHSHHISRATPTVDQVTATLRVKI